MSTSQTELPEGAPDSLSHKKRPRKFPNEIESCKADAHGTHELPVLIDEAGERTTFDLGGRERLGET